MAARKTTKPRPRQRPKQKPRSSQADFFIFDTLRKVADPRISLSELRREGVHLPRPQGRIRERAREFLLRARKQLLARRRRKRA